MKSFRICFVLFISSWNVFSQSDSLKTKYIIDIPILDSPANFENNGLAYNQISPSMQQSLGFSKSIAEIQQYYTKYLFFKPNKKYKVHQKMIRGVAFFATGITFESILGFTPMGSGWLHEEWHRAVLNKNNVRSFNDINTFPIGRQTVAVSQLTDEALANFKATNPSDFVRMGVAGIEAQYEYVKSVQKDNFYKKLNLASSVSYWLNNLNSIQYVRFSSSSDADALTVKAEKEEGVNIKVRDFTGVDFTGWIYDLSRPNEAYSERGIHPSGIGIRRYRQTSDLTSEELNYLKKMGKKQWLNVISPTMFFINSIKLNNDLRFNFAMFHYLTSFGYDAGCNFFFEYKQNKAFIALHNYHNLNNSFYGVEAQLIDKVVTLAKIKLFVTPSLHLWTQPKNQQFRTSDSQFGGKFEVSGSTMLGKSWLPYFTVSAKTPGWVAGDVFLSKNNSFRLGIMALIK
jgi:hypothetical protein